jgi:hemolysin activation/secretion protein
MVIPAAIRESRSKMSIRLEEATCHSIIRCMGLAVALLLASIPSLAQIQAEHFDINRFNIEGNTLLKPDEIETVLKPFTGKQCEYGDVQRAIEALRQSYRSKGFSVVWVAAPEQNLDRGVVTLQVIEARIGKITIAGNQFFNDANIRASLPALREEVSPRAGDISANTQLANENPAKQVDVVLRPSEKLGVVDATVDVIDVKPLKTFLTLDNTGNPQTGDFRLGIGVQHANLFNRDDVGTFNYVTSPGKENQVSLYSGSYRLPLYSRGDSMDFILAYSDVSAGTAQTVAGPLTFSGKGTVYGLRYNQLLERRGEYSQRVVYGLDDRAYKNDCALGNFGAAGCGPAAADITVRPISLTYSGNWAKAGRISDFYVALAHNIPGGANGQESNFNAAHPSPNGGDGAPSHYTTLRFGASMVSAFESNWQVRTAVNAQYTPDALVSGEQFGIAGATAVRGFLEREIARDTGYFVNLELYTPNLTGELVSGEGNLRALLFYDFASAANNPLDGETKQQSLISSIGAGLRWNIQRNFNMRFDLARVIDGGGIKKSGDLGGHISGYFGF